jgi:phage shock protein C
MRKHRRRRRERDDLNGGWDANLSADDIGRDAARLAGKLGDEINRMGDEFHRMADAFHDELGRRRGYAYHAGEAGPGPNPHRLYRSARRAKIAGVCAGVADYFGWRVKWVRISAILLTVFFFPVPIVLYFIAAILMKRPREGQGVYQSMDEERFWRTYSTKPRVTYSELRHRFRALDTRIEQMEYAVTSNEYGLRKQFRDLERGV